ncbi:hypothetical protein BGZ94_006965 [Podila epigama]|nr:hypothetical protein BGZ94_006965 [Podila epigama]
MLSSYPAGRPAQVVWDHRLAHIPSRKKDIYINPSPTAFSSLNTTAVMPANAGACTLTAELYLEWTPSLCRGGEIHGVFSVRSCGDANAADDDDDDDGYLGPRAFQVEYRDPEDRVHRTPVVILDQGEVHTWAPVLTHQVF